MMCRHPLNCEPPLPMLMEKGFITPVSLHYVRNHGAVPKLDWDTHKVKVWCRFSRLKSRVALQQGA